MRFRTPAIINVGVNLNINTPLIIKLQSLENALLRCIIVCCVFFLIRTIDGVVYPGKVKEKSVANKEFDEAVGRGESAGKVVAIR